MPFTSYGSFTSNCKAGVLNNLTITWFTQTVLIICVLPWHSPTGHPGLCLPASFLFQWRLNGREYAVFWFSLSVTFFTHLKHVRVQDANNVLEKLRTKETQRIFKDENTSSSWGYFLGVLLTPPYFRQ